MITTNGLNHLALPVKDPEKSAQFYVDLFNMEITSSSHEMAFLKTIGSTDMIADDHLGLLTDQDRPKDREHAQCPPRPRGVRGFSPSPLQAAAFLNVTHASPSLGADSTDVAASPGADGFRSSCTKRNETPGRAFPDRRARGGSSGR